MHITTGIQRKHWKKSRVRTRLAVIDFGGNYAPQNNNHTHSHHVWVTADESYRCFIRAACLARTTEWDGCPWMFESQYICIESDLMPWQKSQENIVINNNINNYYRSPTTPKKKKTNIFGTNKNQIWIPKEKENKKKTGECETIKMGKFANIGGKCRWNRNYCMHIYY